MPRRLAKTPLASQTCEEEEEEEAEEEEEQAAVGEEEPNTAGKNKNSKRGEHGQRGWEKVSTGRAREIKI
jgi:hypothetical protein